jgi:MinD superfamily P-loop ATPase
MLASSGYVAMIQKELCIDCGDCEDRCLFDAIMLHDGEYQVDRGACMGCGICVDVCSQEALALILAPDWGIPLVIEALLEQRQSIT